MASDYFLKIDGVEGESKAKDHEGEIELLSWSWAENNDASVNTGGGIGAGKVHLQEFCFSMKTSKASPKLMQKCALGEHIPSAKLVCRRAGGEQIDFLVVDFEEIVVTYYGVDGVPNSSAPGASQSGESVEQIRFAFNIIKIEYFEQMQDGSAGGAVTSSWDRTTETP